MKEIKILAIINIGFGEQEIEHTFYSEKELARYLDNPYVISYKRI